MRGPPTAEELVAQAEPLGDPGPASPGAATLDGIPLPPAHLVDQLDNAGQATAEPQEPVEVATLDFMGNDLPELTHKLRYPFRWLGEPIAEITVRQLTTFRVGQICNRVRAQGGKYDPYEIYAEMTGLPAQVLRALPAADGEPVVDRCWDFLPPSLRPVDASASTPKKP